MHKAMEQSSAIKQLLETLFFAIKMCTDFTIDVIYMNTMCAVSKRKGQNTSATALRWFASATADIVFIHIPSMVKPVHTFMTRNRVFKSCLMVELCFHRFAHFDCVPIYIFRFHRKQCAGDSPLSCSVALMSP